MNILQAYVIQYGKFVVVFSSPDENLLKEIVQNLADDFDAVFINLFPYLKDMENIDNDTVSNFFKVDGNVIFVIGPAFPTYYIKNLKFNHNISISLNNTLIEKNNIDKGVLGVYEKYNGINYSFKKNKKNNDVRSSINKTFNLSKYKNNKLLEDDIFKLLIDSIEKKLDSGKYLDKVAKKEENRGEENSVEENSNSLDEDIIEEVELNSYMSDDEMMAEVDFEKSDSDFIIGGMRKLNK
jgi:hypothetical protein